MIAYIIRRLFAIIPVMLLVAVIVFLLVHLTPGDPASVIAGDNATSDQVARIRETLGLDEPLWRQFVIWISRVAPENASSRVRFVGCSKSSPRIGPLRRPPPRPLPPRI